MLINNYLFNLLNFLSRTTLVKYSLLLFFCSFVTLLFAQSDSDCLACHEGNGIETSVNRSAHSKVKCIACHKDAAVKEFPHAERLKKVNCGTCHAKIETQVNNDIHHSLKLSGSKLPTCKSCHGTHAVVRTVSVANKSKQFCSKCHGSKNQLSKPYHADGPKENRKNNICNNCHSDSKASAMLKNSAHHQLSCADCHGYVQQNLSQHQKKLEGATLAECSSCHLELAQNFKKSIHATARQNGSDKTAQCWDCHGSHDIKSVKLSGNKKASIQISESCKKCHPHIANEYDASIHGKKINQGDLRAPTCDYCHSAHKITAINTNNKKAIIKKLQEKTCLSCHKDVLLSAMCIYCHTTHSILPKNDPKASIHKNNIVTTCRQCHKDASEEFAKSFFHISANEDTSMNFYLIGSIAFALLILIVIIYFLLKRKIHEL